MGEIRKPGAPVLPKLPPSPQKAQARPQAGLPRRAASGRAQRAPGQGAPIEAQGDSLERESTAHDAPDHASASHRLSPWAGVSVPDHSGVRAARPQAAPTSAHAAAPASGHENHATRQALARTQAYLRRRQGSPATPETEALTAMVALFSQAPQGLNQEQGAKLAALMGRAQVTDDELLHQAVVASGAMPHPAQAEPVQDPGQRAHKAVTHAHQALVAAALAAEPVINEVRKKAAAEVMATPDDRRRTDAVNQRSENRISDEHALREQRRLLAGRQIGALQPGLMSASERQAETARARAAAQGKTTDADVTPARDDGKGPRTL